MPDFKFSEDDLTLTLADFRQRFLLPAAVEISRRPRWHAFRGRVIRSWRAVLRWLRIKRPPPPELTPNLITKESLEILRRNLVCAGTNKIFENQFKDVGAKLIIRKPSDHNG